MILAHSARAQSAPTLVIAVGFASLTRAAIGGAAPASAVPAAVAFSAILVAAAMWAGARFTRIPWPGVALGIGAATALVGLSLVGLPAVRVGPRTVASVLLWWAPLVAVVAAAEELVPRGVLFGALRDRRGDAVAVAVTAVLFAVIHLPLYGLPSLAIDLCVGLFLGCLRVASGGVAAPLVAHVLADLATGWLG